ncbi:glycosyltransferase [Marinobacter flavimaris]|uniref:Glycosyltransferase n=1 Tax=Marinobacter flavimaris TaxID=262076 RepID=A0A3D8H7Z7_9GAMM|nr:glycosyltransferase family 4 protein [Marinobacter flavimaris]PPI79365.1 hypothetical protein MDHKLMBL_14470 [Marinobacter flavimaris]RDU42777.1 glycosyltransferase [Marinobacter flavimaris]
MHSIKVGLTEMHGIAQEYAKFPPEGVDYFPVETSDQFTRRVFKSAAKGVFAQVKPNNMDIIEAPLFPILTKQPWIYTPAHFSSIGSYDLLGLPTPRFIKMLLAKRILKADNFKKLIFKSQYGLTSLLDYGNITDKDILAKTEVIYPAVRDIPDEKIAYREERLNFLFVGEFFRKGGANVVDAFLKLREKYDHISLTICSNKSLQTSNRTMAQEYLNKIDQCPAIEIGFYDRETLMEKIIPESDIYLCPTYQEAWGFSIQEAMAYGRTIITSDISAIPEMITDNESGLMVPIKDKDFIKNSKGYTVNSIPEDFMKHVTENLYDRCKYLIENPAERERLGRSALKVSRSKFSMKSRQSKMKEIYKSSLL